MKKDVYCKFADGRIKMISFEPIDQKSDWQCLRELIMAMKDLGAVCNSAAIIFQKEKVKKNKQVINVDIDEEVEKEVEDEADIQVLIIKPSSLVAETSIMEVEAVSIQTPAQTLEFQSPDVALLDLPLGIITEEPALDISRSDSPLTFPTQILASVENVIDDAAAHKTKRRKTTSVSRKRQSILKRDDVELPDLPPHLTKFVEQGKEIARSTHFIRFYGLDLWTRTQEPSQNDYSEMGKAIVKRHPQFVDNTGGRPQGLICKLLSNFIRNKKQAIKRAEKECDPTHVAGTSNAVSQTSSTALKKERWSAPVFPAADSQGNPPISDKDLQILLTQLDQVAHMGATTHVISLLEKTFPHRKSVIEKLNSASQVVEKFSQLQQSELLLHELTLRSKVDIPTTLNCLKTCLRELGDFLKFPFDGTEKEQANSVLSMYDALKPKNTSLSAPAPIVIGKALTKPNLDSLPQDGPRLILFFGEDDSMASAFIVADNTIKIKIDRYKFVKTFATLIAAYHSWNIGYPKAYKTLLEFIDEEVFSLTPAKPSTTYKKLRISLRDFRAGKPVGL